MRKLIKFKKKFLEVKNPKIIISRQTILSYETLKLYVSKIFVEYLTYPYCTVQPLEVVK